MKGVRSLRGFARISVVTLAAVFLSACGGGKTQITITEESDNASLYLQLQLKPELISMEAELFDKYFPQLDCLSLESPYAEMTADLVSMFNLKLGEVAKADDSINRAMLLNGPPREEGSVAVYLCNGLQSKAYTLYRSVLVSNSFLAELQAVAIGWDREELFKPAAAFVLYHEIGHAMLNHSAVELGMESGVYFGLPQEIEADQFAYDLLASTGLDIDGRTLADSVGN